MNHILPVASRYQSMLLDKVSKFMAIFPKEKARVFGRTRLRIDREDSPAYDLYSDPGGGNGGNPESDQ